MGHPLEFYLDFRVPSQEERDVEMLLDFLTGATISAIARAYRKTRLDVEASIRRCVLAHGYSAEIPAVNVNSSKKPTGRRSPR